MTESQMGAGVSSPIVAPTTTDRTPGAPDPVDTTPLTAEMVLQPLDEAGARRMVDRINWKLVAIGEAVEKTIAMVQEARDRDAHLALGYRSWPDFVSAEIKVPENLTRPERQEFVGALTATGMPTRAVAKVVHISAGQVSKDLAATASNGSTSRDVTGLNGKSYVVPATVSNAVKGENKRRRRPLPDAYWNAVYDLQKAVERLERLHADDRFETNRQGLHDKHWRQLSDFGALINSMENVLGGGNKCHDCEDRMLPSRDYETRCEKCRVTS